MARVKAVIKIDASPQAVWDIATDLDRMDRWVSIHHHFPGTVPGDLRPGGRFRQALKVAGVKFTVEWTATAVEPPERLAWEGTGPAGSVAETSYTLEPEDGGTLFTFENDFTLPAGRIGRAAGRVVAGQAQKQADESLVALKELVEAQGPRPG